MRKPILVLDFDGVLHSYTSGWQGADVIPDPPVQGAINAIQRYLHSGIDVQILSARSGQDGGIPAMAEWLLKHGLPEDDLAEIKFPHDKPPATVTIDDRAIQFRGQFPHPDEVKNFRTWQNQEV